MRKTELEHIIRAAAAITNEYELVIIGSQSILGAVPNPPDALVESMEADIYPLQHPELADLIDGAIGEASPFHERFGYYAQGVGPDTATLPRDWQSRLVKLQNPNTDLKVGWCLELHDLAVSKLAAGREKDWPFVAAMLAHQLIAADTLLDRLAQTDLPTSHREKLARWVARQR
ncbi:MAG TPA: hypothetical protein PK347_13410 [Burkholderiaceae bacterium]|nr:hypothetical protein [Burkholderiaceae bacterium]